MLFTIVIPAYNCERYISNCLDSVSAQTCHSFELIIVDDGSTDSTPSICDKYADLHNNTQVIHRSNSGPFIARRVGASVAKGEYVIFLDADDALRFDALSLIAKAIAISRADIICFRWSRKRDYSSIDDLDPLPSGNYIDTNYNFIKEKVCTAQFNNLCGRAFRLSCIDLSKSYDDSGGFVYAEDLAQLLPIIDSAESLMCIDDILYYYRPSTTSTAGNYKATYIDNTEHAASYLLEYGDKWGMHDAAINGVFSLYVGVLKPLVDYANPNDKKSEILRLGSSLKRTVPYVNSALTRCRLDYRLMLRAVLNGHTRKVCNLVRISHAARSMLNLLHKD